MESASPTATASTNRGGRPKDWTEPRTRRLIRLYLFTTLPFPKILELLEEDEFKPGKDAANKVKNSVLGNDPRWIRPKDEQEEKARISGLRNSIRGRRSQQNKPSHDLNGAAPDHSSGFRTFLEDRSFGGTTLAHSYRSSIEELHHQDSAPFAYPSANNDTFTTVPDDAGTSRFIPSLIGRFTSRQDTGLTTSTDISIASALREKLSFLSLSRAKRTVKVLKRYTFPKDLESQHPPDVSASPFVGPEFYTPAHATNGLSNAAYAVPGDFLNDELFAYQERCASESPAHGHCWCKVDEQVSPIRNMWANLKMSSHVSDPALTVKDVFGNTIFHRLASLEGIQDLVFYLVCQALREPNLPIRDTNSAGQTFLHVLHRSWFQEGSKLTDLLDTLRAENFDIFATDVYGRSVYHNLRAFRRASARFPGQPSDLNRMNRRDAFGMKPMDTRTSPDISYAAAPQTSQRGNTNTPATSTRPVPRINTQTVEDKEFLIHTDLLKVVLTAVGVDETFSPNAQNEDSQGRNGFHCLAEVDFYLSPSTPRPGSRGRRLECIDGLINAGVDANQYDKNGNTPLMSFVINSSDATKCEKEECEHILRALVQKAGARLELRNRNGETALHLAARHGKTVALRVLLEMGANPHTRNCQGLSILEVLDNLYVTTERDDKNNARFEACRAILTRTKDYAKQSPSLEDEWHVR
ncbi:hypothetical protein GQX73_g6445 [Xylaria multiplex]|uniref:Uncharacterized protein n=1 Tax=Xylaria multiplex TaxID=323545 RepID=A0A7C8MQQ6_9PEZI|nr:hypothetical protein GQX73_g6445 [Xylaria multiplex]